MTADLVFRPNDFFAARTRSMEARFRETQDVVAISAVLLAASYFLVVAANYRMESIGTYVFATLVFNVSNLVLMALIYSGLSKAVCPQVPFMVHFSNAACTAPILCLAAILSQDYSEALLHQRLDGTAQQLSGTQTFGVFVVLLGYAWIARLVYAGLLHDAKARRVDAFFVASLGFAATLYFMHALLEPAYGRLLRVIIV